ncbi:MAG TPA: hypothetical protein VIM55_14925 [Mucilaginibacter sp.]
MKTYAVITGDIKNFTMLSADRRSKLIADTEQLMKTMVQKTTDAQVFRGDSYQLIIDDVTQVLKRCIQLICWFKINSGQYSLAGRQPKSADSVPLGTRLSIGIGEIAYEGKNVLDSDGEAFHLSGRKFDQLNKDDIIKLTTRDEKSNEVFEILLMFMNAIIRNWTRTQAETILLLLEKDDNTQEQIARKLGTTQPAIAFSLRAARWKEVEKGISYINKELKKQYPE